MKLVILGATGGTGQQILSQALQAGHEVTVFARHPERITINHDRLRVVKGDVLDEGSALGEAMADQDVVLSALGRGTSFRSEGLIRRSVPAVLSVMQTHSVRRLVFASAIGVGDAIRDAPLFSRILIRFMLHDIYEDKAAGEEIIRRSALDWTIVQPAQLTNGPLTRTYRAGERLRVRGIPRISRADTAHFMLSTMASTVSIRKILRLAY